MLEVAKYCKEIGLEKIIYTHISTFTTLDLEKLKKAMDICGYAGMNESMLVEATPEAVRNTREDFVRYIREFTPERCIITTDAGSVLFPRPAIALRKAIGVYLDAGFTDEEITVMVKTNPEKLLGLK